MVKICVTFDILRFLSELRFNVSQISRRSVPWERLLPQGRKNPQIYFHRLRLNPFYVDDVCIGQLHSKRMEVLFY